MCIPWKKTWKKMKKDERQACANYVTLKGFCVFLFGAIWWYFMSVFFDVWRALPPTLAVMGILVLLYGLFKRTRV